jgi:hypothetical protein
MINMRVVAGTVVSLGNYSNCVKMSLRHGVPHFLRLLLASSGDILQPFDSSNCR